MACGDHVKGNLKRPVCRISNGRRGCTLRHLQDLDLPDVWRGWSHFAQLRNACWSSWQPFGQVWSSRRILAPDAAAGGEALAQHCVG